MIEKSKIEGWINGQLFQFYDKYKPSDPRDTVMFSAGYLNCLEDLTQEFGLDPAKCIPVNAKQVENRVELPAC
jgi:hypothetical protein